MGLAKWLKRATSPALNFWHNKTNRSYVENYDLAVSEVSDVIELPFNTWMFKIHGVSQTAGAENWDILFEDGSIVTLRAPTATQEANFLNFEGQPYIPRSDRFRVRNNSATDPLEVQIIFHVIIEANT